MLLVCFIDVKLYFPSLDDRLDFGFLLFKTLLHPPIFSIFTEA